MTPDVCLKRTACQFEVGRSKSRSQLKLAVYERVEPRNALNNNVEWDERSRSTKVIGARTAATIYVTA